MCVKLVDYALLEDRRFAHPPAMPTAKPWPSLSTFVADDSLVRSSNSGLPASFTGLIELWPRDWVAIDDSVTASLQVTSQ
ncbi:hypothetical protein Thiosp_03250 [Thiorhodovibrio litoralis]|nr:hypothetical protein [Thiorhodovibrio winogradskyi]WPL13449.1 hypothetical protein Thiosp_03250 [Thiorhodovibrio litoralis]